MEYSGLRAMIHHHYVTRTRSDMFADGIGDKPACGFITMAV